MIKKLNISFGLIFFIFGLYFIFKNNLDLDINSRIQIIFIFIFSLIGVFLPILSTKYIQKLPLINLTNLYFLICYVGVFFFDKNKVFFFSKYNNQEYSNAISVLFAGYISFHLEYLLFNYLIKNFKRKSFQYLTCSYNEILIIGVSILISVIFLFYLIEIQNYFIYFSQIKYPLLLFGTGLCYYYLIEKKNINKFYFFLLIFIILIPIIFELLKGAFNFPFMIMFLLYVYYLIVKKKINLLPFILIALVFLFVHLGKNDYRKKTWSSYGIEENLTFFDKSKIFFDTYFTNQTEDLKIENLVKRSDGYITERRIFHSFWSLVIVTKETPQNIPYWDGYSYKILSSKIIPRIFWEKKPSDRLGNEFGHRYNIINKGDGDTPRDNHTSWNMPVLNEFYVNYGFVGVIVGMMLIGILFSLLSRVFSIKENNNTESIIAFYIFVPLFFLESHLSLLFGAIIQSYIFLIIVSCMMLYILRKIR